MPNTFTVPVDPSDREREDASYSYIISVVIAVVGSPLPVLNLLGCTLYYIMVKKHTYFVRFHALQALLAQIFTSLLGTVFVGWTLGLVFGDTELNAAYVGFGCVVALVFVLDTGISIWAGIHARKGRMVHVEFLGYLTHLLLYRHYRQVHEQGQDVNIKQPWFTQTPSSLPGA